MLILRSDPARKAIRTFLQGFLGIFGISLVGFLGDLTRWASESERAFPSVNPLGKAAVAAFAAGAAGVVTFAWNAIEDKTGHPILVAKSVPDPEPTQEAEEEAVAAAGLAVDTDLPEGSSPGVVEDFDHEDLVVTPEDEDWTAPVVTVHEPDPQMGRVSENEGPGA